jgi:hypothetical protein
VVSRSRPLRRGVVVVVGVIAPRDVAVTVIALRGAAVAVTVVAVIGPQKMKLAEKTKNEKRKTHQQSKPARGARRDGTRGREGHGNVARAVTRARRHGEGACAAGEEHGDAVRAGARTRRSGARRRGTRRRGGGSTSSRPVLATRHCGRRVVAVGGRP